MEHFYQNIHGWFDYENVYKYAVRLFPSGADFCEVGVYKGKATAYLGTEITNAGKQITVTCVDIFEPSKIMALGGDSYSLEEFKTNIAPISEHITICKGESVLVAKDIQNKSMDFIFIDAGHTYEEVLSDIQSWLPKLKPGGIIAGHDYSANWPGIEQAVREVFGTDFITTGACWMHVKHNNHCSLTQFQNYVTVLNQERSDFVTKELDKFGVSFSPIQCVTLKDLPEDSNVWQANGHSFLKAFNAYKATETEKPLLVLEDDIKFTANPNHTIKKALAELPENWDLLYLGSNIQAPCKPYSNHLDRMVFGWCTHSVAYSHKAIDYILKKFNPMTDYPFDEWLRLQPFNAFVTRPTLITQRSGFSYIQNTDVNYECIFNSQINLTK